VSGDEWGDEWVVTGHGFVETRDGILSTDWTASASVLFCGSVCQYICPRSPCRQASASPRLHKAITPLTSPAKGARFCPQRRRRRTSFSRFLLLLLFQLGSRSTPHPAIYSVSGEHISHAPSSPTYPRPPPVIRLVYCNGPFRVV